MRSCCPRMNGGKRRPIHLQRMEADDLLAAVWPGLAACQENAPAGPVAVPDHVLARQTVDDCLHEGLSVEGLVEVWAQIESGAHRGAHGRVVGAVALRPCDLERAPLHLSRRRAARGAAHAGPLAAARPRRARSRRAARAGPRAGRARPRRGGRGARPGPAAPARPRRAARPVALARGGPAVSGLGRLGTTRWPPTAGRACSTAAGWPPSAPRPRPLSASDDDAAAACVAGHLQLAGPVTRRAAGRRRTACPRAPRWVRRSRAARARTALARLEAGGSAIELPDGRWCARNLLVRLHGASRSRRRGLVEAVPIADFVRFLTHWQHATPDSRARGSSGAVGGPRTAAGDRGAGGGVGGPDPAGPCQRLRPSVARRAVPVR